MDAWATYKEFNYLGGLDRFLLDYALLTLRCMPNTAQETNTFCDLITLTISGNWPKEVAVHGGFT